ncbi:tetratricopeptide repeat protein [Burkholderia ubonensis]|uniref:tetratricopeptide repeat protein n=1 Tax=Burkholderia ubonensis TaxID=101571 RepID=UPI00075A4888|nr:tetratricopeptide repeat protein [Burkholderia ubonensis]KVN50065.1 hemin-binding protein [Burkholderia ubonensis]
MKLASLGRREHPAFRAVIVLIAMLIRNHCAAQSISVAEVTGKASAGKVETERIATRRQVYAAASSGAWQLALQEARKRPDAFTEKDLFEIETLGAANEASWGYQQSVASDGPDRLDQYRGTLQHIDDILFRLPSDADYADVRRSLQAERLITLRGLGRMREAVALYRALGSSPDPLPAYAYAAAGDAYTYLDRPRDAAPAYERALQTPNAPLSPSLDPHTLKRIDVEEGLFFAYLDAGHYEDAQSLLKSIVVSTPVRADLAENPEDLNEDYGRVQKLQAQYLLYTGHTREGIAALDKLRREAPFAPELISARSDASLVKQRPREAQQLYASALVDHPGDIEILAGLGKTALELNCYERAAEISATFGDRFPDNNTVKSLQREFAAYRSPQLIIAANGQKGNAILADNDWGIDTQVYSMPIAGYWRVFAHQFSGRANTGDGNSVSRIRNGIGGDFRMNGIDAMLEVNRSTGPEARTGVAGSLTYRPDDAWIFSTGIDTNTNALPWKAYQVGVNGRAATGAIRYSVDDRRYLELGYGVTRYTDANLNQQWHATWYEQLMNIPRHLIATWVELDTNSNTLANTAYFNPTHDLTTQATAMYQWTPWRDADRWFAQRVYTTLGGYRQTDIGNSLLWEVRLEQQWQFATRASLSYGIGVASQRMDRSRETSKLVYLNFNVPL